MTDTPETDATPSSPQGFERLGLRAEILSALATLGYEEPTPIQRAAIPVLMAGRDVLARAATGTGKTAAFSLPLLQRLGPSSLTPNTTRALVIVPTRELATQVAEAIHRYGKGLGTQVLPVYGGADIMRQLRRLERGVDVIVATPGRALDHLRRGSLKFDRVQCVVLDEADEMLDMGFADELDELLAALPPERQTALFSATLPPRIAKIANSHLRDPERISVADEKPTGEVPRVRQVAYAVPRSLKEAALVRVLDVEEPQSALVFCRTRLEVDRLTDALCARGMSAEGLHGGLSQEQRERVLRKFRSGEVELLLATDVAARGLDVEGLTHVFNYDLPPAPEPYVHRVGRTGRAGREGVAITLVEPREIGYLRSFERAVGQKINIEQLPSLDDLRTKQRQQTRALVEQALAGEESAAFRTMVAELSGSAEIVDIAAAAIAALHASIHPGDEEQREIPSFVPPAPGADRGPRGVPQRGGYNDRFNDRGPRPDRGYGPPQGDRGYGPPSGDRGPDRGPPAGDRGYGPPAGDRGYGPPAGDRGPRPERASEFGGDSPRERAPRAPRDVSEDMVSLYVSVGHEAGVRPGDLVGAIANEAGLSSRSIGHISIGERHSFVEVERTLVTQVMEALRRTIIRGRKVKVDVDRRPPAPRGGPRGPRG